MTWIDRDFVLHAFLKREETGPGKKEHTLIKYC